MSNDVIAAISTPPGRGGIGVVRVSGPHLETFLNVISGARVRPRRATRITFRGADASIIDQGLLLYFPGPHSYTGEDVIELQGHGGPIVLQSLLKRCLELGARVAEPGEFTKRAFLNDKLDLAQAESVADLIDATTTAAARCAMRSLQGLFSERVHQITAALTELRALVEATLDFPEDDVDFIDLPTVGDRLERIRQRLAETTAASRQGSLLRDGINVVLAGQPNVGKSSLMNCLAGADRAIVTEIPGTTRDTIRETINLCGVPLHLIDTAGLREPSDKLEEHGISRAWSEISKADLVLWVSDVTRPETADVEPALVSRFPTGVPRLRVINKIDLLDRPPLTRALSSGSEIELSAMTRSGIELLEAAILNAAGASSAGEEGLFMARERHLQALHDAARHVNLAIAHIGSFELLAEELRLAQRALASITGEVTADDLLGEIFSRFCIGK